VELFSLAERAGLPVVGPLAGDSDGHHYTFRLHGGELEQGRALGEFAGLRLALADPPTVVLAAARDAALAGAVQGQLARHGWQQVRQQALPAAWDTAVSDWQRQGVRVLFFFGSPGEFAALQHSVAAAGWPVIVLAPAGRAGSAALAGAGPLFLAVPALPGDGTPGGRRAFAELRQAQALPERQLALQAAAYAATAVLLEGLKRVGRVASRERLVDALENLHAYETGVTPAIGFGPGRRVGIMGAHVLSVDPVSRRLQAAGGFVSVD
jgi:ABC-type branched-subunit amino acid transport system substrate-binding protein